MERNILDPVLATDPDRRLTGTETAKFLGVTPNRLRIWERQGVLLPVERTLGGTWYRFGDVKARARGETRLPPTGRELAAGHAA